MNRKLLFAILVLTLSSIVTAFAQSDPAIKPPSLLENLIWSIVPILIIALFVWVFFLRAMKKIQARGLEHSHRVEQLLERIAKAVESKHKNEP